MITFYGQEFSELKTPYNIVVAADVLEFVQGLTEWISYIMMLKYGGTSIGNESVTEPSRARADEKRRAEWLKPVRRHIILYENQERMWITRSQRCMEAFLSHLR